ncbi:hypothetical protein [Tranquillimonas alkanivorans]|uniref:Uncharacterized protein n=1 Tax=Tranquillimonas alkanivorans TaxID=441119 RepID=A0A1I5TVC1_9RHOB|nr:hypothetical protein [Tranquillimonas alkanivorans]SFP86948.1 hypothetical protein SAMN04488047_11545 [Tranquillimonas alkanivorans]
MTLKTEVTGPNGKSSYKTIPSELSLLTVAKVTLPEPDRMAAARRWIGSDCVFGEREAHLLEGFWKLLDTAPEGFPVSKIEPRHVIYRGG